MFYIYGSQDKYNLYIQSQTMILSQISLTTKLIISNLKGYIHRLVQKHGFLATSLEITPLSKTMLKSTFSFHKQNFYNKCSNDYCIYLLIIVHHFHHDVLYWTRIIL